MRGSDAAVSTLTSLLLRRACAIRCSYVPLKIPEKNKGNSSSFLSRFDSESFSSSFSTLARDGPGLKDFLPQPRTKRPMPPPPPRQAIPGVKHIVAVSSGKGGVGKSTVAVNLAAALSLSGLRASILDADVHGPSVPRLLGTWNKRARVDEDTGTILPLETPSGTNNGVLRSLSMGNLVGRGAAAVWRGPMVMSAIETLTRKADWRGTDVMVVDMPPGTGDAHLSVAQRLPLAGAVVVATPQKVALDDVERGARGWEAAGVGVIGIVENMSGFACSGCGKIDDVFGGGGSGGDDDSNVSKASSLLNAPLLGKVPLSRVLRVSCDEGEPIVFFSEERRRADPGARACAEALEGVAARVREILKI